jgi:hypothetical protein
LFSNRIRRAGRALAARAEAIELLVGLACLVAGTWKCFSAGAALIVAGLFILGLACVPVLVPILQRKGQR